MTAPVVSVIIVSWNARDYLEQCLDSLAVGACDYPIEVVVVDNASNDGSPDMVRTKFPQVRLIETGANLGFAKANNVGIRQSQGKYVCLVNSDVRVLAGCITRLVDFCEAHPDTGMAGPLVYGGDGKVQRSCRGFPSLWNMFCRALALDELFPGSAWAGGYLLPHWKQDTQRAVDILSGCFWLVRRDALDKAGLLDENFFMYGEDMDWCKRFWANGWQIMFVPSAEAIHYGGGSSANAPLRFFIEKQRADLQYWRKHHCWLAQKVYFLICCLHHLLRMIGYACAWLSRRGEVSTWRYKMVRGWRCLQWMVGAYRPDHSQPKAG